MSAPILTIEIRGEHDVVLARQRARQVAALLEFDAQDQTRIATAVSEIARNVFSHAGGGTVAFLVESSPAEMLVIRVQDGGSGIVELPRVLEGRYASKAGMGLGILAARRLMDRFDVESSRGRGTAVVLGKALPTRARPLAPQRLGRIAEELARLAPQTPFEEIRQQNQELLRALDDLRARQEQLARLYRELEDTNRGVVALYAELDEQADRLRRADELKSRFLSNMSHEFRTPLNSILAISRLLLERVDGDLTAEQSRQVTLIRRAAEGLSELVNDLLDLAKVEAGKVVVRPVEFSAADLFSALKGMLRPLLLSSAVSLVFEDPVDVPRLWTDEGKVSQILRNFLSNALKFTERGEIRVAAALDPARDAVAFSVADTGVGIAPEDQERIFQEFAQVEGPHQTRVKGTGLGLPLSRRLAELLGGSVSVQSAPGLGSTFTAVIPCTFTAPAEETAPSEEPDPMRFPVLVIEDDPETVLLYQKYLKGTGFQVLQARTLRQARRLLDRVRPLAIVLDVLLPGEESWTFLSTIKGDEATREIPVFVVSVVDNKPRGLALGADDYCVKPVDRKWLLNALRRVRSEVPAGSILVIDDDEASRYVIRNFFTDTRYAVLEAASGAEGLRRARDERPAVIVLDLLMPEMSGFELLDRLEADPATRDLPVIINTSKVLDSDERRRLSAHAVAILSKEGAAREATVAAVRHALTQAPPERVHQRRA